MDRIARLEPRREMVLTASRFRESDRFGSRLLSAYEETEYARLCLRSRYLRANAPSEQGPLVECLYGHKLEAGAEPHCIASPRFNFSDYGRGWD